MSWSKDDLPSPMSLFSTYASMAASLMFFRSLVNEFVPQPVIDFLISLFHRFFNSHSSSDVTLTFEDGWNMGPNEIFEAAELYLSTKISPKAEKLKISKRSEDKTLTFHLQEGETVTDTFHGTDMKWTLVGRDKDDYDSKRSFQLCFREEQRDLVLGSYITFVLDQSSSIKDNTRELRMHTLSNDSERTWWDSVVLDHPSTLETVAMPEDQKRCVVEDLDRFVKRRDFYKRVGRAWKRGYLLYGPPGTGKSSLVAAMANHLKFDVYDLQLALVRSDSDLRTLLLNVANKSIIVIEDIDCSVNLPDRIGDDSGDKNHETKTQLTLSGLLNFIDGLWSSCGDERIIIFTTNHKEKLDPALLRPGRMDIHIHMSYCTFHAFKVLASNYLGISDHRLYEEIEDLLNSVQVTPAQVAEEFMREDVDLSLRGLLKLLKEKKIESDHKNEDI